MHWPNLILRPLLGLLWVVISLCICSCGGGTAGTDRGGGPPQYTLIKGSLLNVSGEPINDATIIVTADGAETTSDLNGDFELSTGISNSDLELTVITDLRQDQVKLGTVSSESSEIEVTLTLNQEAVQVVSVSKTRIDPTTPRPTPTPRPRSTSRPRRTPRPNIRPPGGLPAPFCPSEVIGQLVSPVPPLTATKVRIGIPTNGMPFCCDGLLNTDTFAFVTYIYGDHTLSFNFPNGASGSLSLPTLPYAAIRARVTISVSRSDGLPPDVAMPGDLILDLEYFEIVGSPIDTGLSCRYPDL